METAERAGPNHRAAAHFRTPAVDLTGRLRRLASPLHSEASALFIGLAAPGVLFYLFLGKAALALCFAAILLALSPAINARAGDGAHGIARSPAPVWIACLVAAIGLTTIGGEGRLLPATADWLVRDAVLNDLVRQPWPFVYRFDDKDWLLRAPLGMYLGPAAIGKLAGLRAAHLALWVQNSAAIFVLLRILCGGGTIARSLVVLTVFCIFSGWDAIGAALTHFTASASRDIEWWAGAFQYSSTMTLAFWAPNHAIPGWTMAALLLLWDTGKIRIGLLMMGAAVSILWSPFALIGAAPFLVKAGLEAFGRGRIWGDVGISLLLTIGVAPLAFFLITDGHGVPHGFEPMSGLFAAVYVLFIGIELAPVLAINSLATGEREGFARSTFRLAVATLLLLPFYSMGAANDFVMRASIPALAIVAITTGHSAYLIFREGEVWKKSVTGVCLALGLLTGASETWFILTAPNTGVSACDLIQVWDQYPGPPSPKTHYLAEFRHVPGPLRPEGVTAHPTGSTTSRCIDQRL